MVQDICTHDSVWNEGAFRPQPYSRFLRRAFFGVPLKRFRPAASYRANMHSVEQ